MLKDSQVHFAEQQKRLGTGHATKVGMKALPEFITDVLVIQGDDSHFYKKEKLAAYFLCIATITVQVVFLVATLVLIIANA